MEMFFLLFVADKFFSERVRIEQTRNRLLSKLNGPSYTKLGVGPRD